MPVIGGQLPPPQNADTTDLLFEFLHDPNPKVRLLTLKQFSEICDQRWILYVTQALQDSDPEVRKAARETLLNDCHAEETDLATLDIMIALLENPDPLVRVVACNLLGNNPQPRTIPFLLQKLDDPDSRVRDRAALALANIHFRFPIEDKGTLKKIGNRLVALLGRRRAFSKRVAADDVAEMKVQEAWIPLTRLLRDRDSRVRYAAMRALVILNPRQAIDSLITMTRDKDDFIQEEAIQKLGELRARKAIKPLTEIIKKEKGGWVLEEALDALAAIGDLPDLEIIFRLSTEGQRNTIHSPDWALAHLAEKDERARAFLFQKLNAPTQEIRLTALRILALVDGIEKNTVELQKSLADLDTKVRLSGAQILSSNKAMRQGVIAVLKEIAENKTEDEKLREAAIETLAKAGGDAVIENLMNLISDENNGIRRTVVDSLGRIQSERIKPILVGLLKAPDKCVQEQAGDTLYRMLHPEKEEEEKSHLSKIPVYPTSDAEII